MTAFSPTRVGLIIAGLEVPHTHLHIIPIDSEADLSFSKADPSPEPAALDDAAERLRQALRAMGRAEVPSSPSARSQKRALRGGGRIDPGAQLRAVFAHVVDLGGARSRARERRVGRDEGLAQHAGGGAGG